MPAIAAVVVDLLARPRPVLCLDTCDLLDVIQCVAEGQAAPTPMAPATPPANTLTAVAR